MGEKEENRDSGDAPQARFAAGAHEAGAVFALETQPAVLVAAARTLGELSRTRRCVEIIAPDAVKRGFATLALEALVVPSIIVKPQTEKNHGDEHAIDDNGGGEIKHDETPNG
jgi:hypothetical protein